jgi:hypothetical protein
MPFHTLIVITDVRHFHFLRISDADYGNVTDTMWFSQWWVYMDVKTMFTERYVIGEYSSILIVPLQKIAALL